MNPRQGMLVLIGGLAALAPLVISAPPSSARPPELSNWPVTTGQFALTANNRDKSAAAGTPTRTPTPYRGYFPIPIATSAPNRASGPPAPPLPIQPYPLNPTPTTAIGLSQALPGQAASAGPGDALAALVPPGTAPTEAPGAAGTTVDEAPAVTESSEEPAAETETGPSALPDAARAAAAESAGEPAEVAAAPVHRPVTRRVFRGAGGRLAGPAAAPGFAVHLFYVDKAPVIDAVVAAGFGWVKQQVPWAAIQNGPEAYDWTELDQVVDAVTDADLGLVLSIAKAPRFYRASGDDGPPDDPATLRRFTAVLAARYQGRVQAYEIWNEANLAVEWGYGQLDAGSFVRLLRAGYEGVKASDPEALVIAGAMTPTGVNDWQLAVDDVDYLRAMYAYEGGVVRHYFDALGAHPSGFNNPPDDDPDHSTKQAPENRFKGHWSFYFRRVEQLRQVMVENGDADKQLWLTEFGWASSPIPAEGYEYAADISEEDQATFLVRAYQRAREEYPWIGLMAVWNLNFQTLVDQSDEKWAFGLIRPDWSPRPAYTALEAMPK